MVIALSYNIQENGTELKLLGYTFQLIQELDPARNPSGTIKEFFPQEEYTRKDTTPLNKYGKGPFCRFSLRKKGFWGIGGVYALVDSSGLLYIGQTINFEQRFNTGYGNISPRNCYIGGQSTNCKINTMILNKYLDGERIDLFFYETPNYNNVEAELIEILKPPYNSSRVIYTREEVSNKKLINNPTIRKGNKEKIIQYMNQNDGSVFCDDCLSDLCKITRRQQVNQICNGYEGTLFLSEKADCSYCGKKKKVRKLKK